MLGYMGIIFGLILVGVLIYFSRVMVYVSNDEVGIVERLWSFSGSVTQGIVALNGEAGIQPEVIRGGFHFVGLPFQHSVYFEKIVTIPPSQQGYVFALDGVQLPSDQVLGNNSKASNFYDVRDFLLQGGNKGPQRKILREGAHPINTAQFVVITKDAIYATGIAQNGAVLDKIKELQEELINCNGFFPVSLSSARDQLGVVTVLDGPALPHGEIIAPEVGNVRGVKNAEGQEIYHDSFQDPEKFLLAGGFKGRQLQVIVEGTYFINRLFADVQLVSKTLIPIGHVGVVISYTGEKGTDLSGSNYQHGELVDAKSMGVREEPLLPGKYALNTFSCEVQQVPTTNFILKWENNTNGSQFDKNLKEVSLITKDAFEPDLPLSVVVHVDYRKASRVIQRFGDIQKLVEQTLDPMVSAYFKNIAQTKTLIELLQHRSEIQVQAKAEMATRFSEYNLELQEVLIGTPKSKAGDMQIEVILAQLRDRQVARESIETYQQQQASADAERALNETRARAAQQPALTQSEIQIKISENEGSARVIMASKQAEETINIAKGEAERVRLTATAEAERISAVGNATAETAQKQVEAMGGADYRLQQVVAELVAGAVKEAGLAIVPQVSVGGEQGGNAMTGLISTLLATKVQDKLTK